MFTKIINATMAFALFAGVTLAAAASPAQAMVRQQQQWSNVLDESAATQRGSIDAPLAQ